MVALKKGNSFEKHQKTLDLQENQMPIKYQILID
jgi:hypothetical protein